MDYPQTIGNMSWVNRVVCLGFLGLVLISAGCDDDDCCTCIGDAEAPAAPRGLYSVTGDGKVTLHWYANTESDLDGYYVFRGDDGIIFDEVGKVVAYEGDYELTYVDRTPDNGDTYYYAVSAYDFNNNESELSLENIFDTPRPEGSGYVDCRDDYPESAGYDISRDRRVDSTDQSADFIYYSGANANEYLIEAGTGVWIQDMGYTGSFNEIGWAPGADFENNGWSPSGIVEAILGHTYVLLTANDQYAKIRLTSLPDQISINFDWALQEDHLNQELFVQ